VSDYAKLRAAVADAFGHVMVDSVDLGLLLAEVDKLRAAAPVKKPRAKKAAPAAAGAGPVLPDWLPLEAWHAFLDMRKKIKKPATDYAQTLLVKKLGAFYANDLDPGVILNQSIMNGWQDLYAPKEASTAYRGAGGRVPVADQNRTNNVAALALLDQVNFDMARTIDECQ
jgi:hypothetical protein